MSCDVGEVRERLENELCYDYNYELCSFSNLSVPSTTLQLILQPFRRFTYVTAHSPTLPLLLLRNSSFSNPSFASPASQALHLIHLASRSCTLPKQENDSGVVYNVGHIEKIVIYNICKLVNEIIKFLLLCDLIQHGLICDVNYVMNPIGRGFNE